MPPARLPCEGGGAEWLDLGEEQPACSRQIHSGHSLAASEYRSRAAKTHAHVSFVCDMGHKSSLCQGASMSVVRKCVVRMQRI
jgi:hypothetical protein